MSKVFVAGGSGRVATELIKDLIKDGNEGSSSRLTL